MLEHDPIALLIKTYGDRNTKRFTDEERGRDLNDSPVTTLTAVLSEDDITRTKSSLLPP